MTQDAFANAHGITSRTLRKWLRETSAATPATSVVEARAIIDDAIVKLERLRERLVPAGLSVRFPPMEEQRPSAPERLPAPADMWNLT